jgi:hypothetical protein
MNAIPGIARRRRRLRLRRAIEGNAGFTASADSIARWLKSFHFSRMIFSS